MSGLALIATRFFLKASPRRTYAETLLVFLSFSLIGILAYQTQAAELSILSLVFFVNPCTALYFSLRLKMPSGNGPQRLALDIARTAVPALLLNGLIWVMLRAGLLASHSNVSDVQLNDPVYLGFLAFPYLFFRVGAHLLIGFNHYRRHHLIGALVSSILLAVALFQMLVVVLFTTVLVVSGWSATPNNLIPDYALAQWLYRLQVSLPLVGAAMIAASLVLLLIFPVALLVAHGFTQGIRRRLHSLLGATHMARDGDYETQVLVNGQDEIAELQTNFNVMTAHLKIHVEALRNERATVAALLHSRRELMAMVSHELRTPIATMRAVLESGQPQLHNDGLPVSARDLGVIHRETLRLQTLVDDLFALSCAEVELLALKLTAVDAAALIHRVIETIGPLAWWVNRVEVVADLAVEPFWVRADEARLEQVFLNLIHNSLRHTPPGGLVIIRGRVHNEAVEIQVQDTGSGIAPTDLPHVWERYYRDPETGGTGLGLPLVKSFIEAMQGQVAVTSMLGEGACFTIRLPLAHFGILPDTEPNVALMNAHVFPVWVADQRFVYDTFAAWSATDALFAGKLDLTRLGSFGHSFGGATALEVCRVEVRCGAAVDMDGGLYGDTATQPAVRPLMLMISTDSLQNAKAVEKWRQMVVLAQTKGNDAAYWLEVPGSTHLSFTITQLLSPILVPAGYEPRAGLGIMDCYLRAFFDPNAVAGSRVSRNRCALGDGIATTIEISMDKIKQNAVSSFLASFC